MVPDVPPVTRALDRASPLSSLMQRLRHSQACLEAVKEVLPPSLAALLTMPVMVWYSSTAGVTFMPTRATTQMTKDHASRPISVMPRWPHGARPTER